MSANQECLHQYMCDCCRPTTPKAVQSKLHQDGYSEVQPSQMCNSFYMRFVCACLSEPFILQYAFHCIYSVFNTFVLPRITSSRTPSIRWANGSSGRLRPLSPMPTSLAQISVLQVECYLCWPLVGPVLVTVGHHCHWNLQQLCLSARPPFHQY